MATVLLYRDVITTLMDRYRYTASDVARLAGLSGSAVRNVINGSRTSVELDTARQIARALHVSVTAIANVDLPHSARVS